MRPTLPVLLSIIGGHVDTAGFLALQGLSTAHVTGNFVTFGAAAYGSKADSGKPLPDAFMSSRPSRIPNTSFPDRVR